MIKAIEKFISRKIVNILDEVLNEEKQIMSDYILLKRELVAIRTDK